MSNRNILVTGAGGFIGANLVRRLLSEGHDVTVLLRKNESYWRLQDVVSNLSVATCDLRLKEDVDTMVVSVQPDWVFHTAAFGAYSWQTEGRKIVDTNFMGTLNLIEACLRLTKFEAFINAGSSSEYGLKDHAPSESEWLEPNSIYAVAKASASMLCRSLAQTTQKQIVTLRLYSVFGPFEEPNRLLPTLVVEGLKGLLPPLADPKVARDFVYIDDVVDCFIKAAETEGQEIGAIYNVGTGVQTTLEEIAHVAVEKLGIDASPKWGTMGARDWDTNIWVADNSKVTKTLSWKPEFTLSDGFEATVRWFKENPQLLQSIYS